MIEKVLNIEGKNAGTLKGKVLNKTNKAKA